MISSVFTLKESTFIPNELVSNPETKLEENYYVNSTLKFLTETQNELLSYKQDFYKTVLESSDDNYIIQESFNDVISKIKTIIKKILAYIETLVKRFVTQLAKFVSSDRYIAKMKNEINKFTDDDSFEIDGYIFTFDDNVPVTEIPELDLGRVKAELKDLNDKDITDKIVAINAIISKYTENGRIDDIRGRILNVNHPITETSFMNEAFAAFRDGKGEESFIDIKRAEVMKAYNDYQGYKEKIKATKRTQNTINNKYKTLESQIDSMITSELKLDGESTISSKVDNYTSSTQYRINLKSTLDTLINMLVNQIQRIANLHVEVFAAKLDAYNAATIQDKKVLYTALNKVQKQIKNTKMMESVNFDAYGFPADYTRETQYNQFLTEKYFMNLRQQRFVEECLALSESNIPELKVIQEDLKMDAKNKFEKMKQFVKQMFEKFMMKLNSFIKRDKGLLVKYKDVILTKKIPETTFNNMPEYTKGIENIKNFKLPDPNFKDILSDTEDGIRKKVLPAYDGKGDFTDFAKDYFLCGNTERKDRKNTTNDPELNMKNIYDFCLTAPAAINVIKADNTAFENRVKKIQAEILKVAHESYIPIEELYYSSVLESFVNEEGEKAEPADSKGTTMTPNNQTNNSSGEANSNAKIKFDRDPNDNKSEKNKDINKQVKSDVKDNNDAEAKKQAEENKGSDKKKVAETGDWYLRTVQTVLAAKLTAFQKIYSEYMKIIRYHIRQATGDLGSTNKFSKEDQEKIIQDMKDYLNADDQSKKDAAADSMINTYKSRGVVIDRHDVDSIANSNKAALGIK